jgi:hypothetical protein
MAEEIIDKAVKKLHELTGFEVAWKREQDDKSLADGIITIGTTPEVKLEVTAKNEIREQQLFGLLDKIKQLPKPHILICRYIPMPLKNRLKSGGVNYLETAGNCFIHFKTLFIFINDQKVTPEREINKSKLWKPAGVKFVFAILNQPELLNASYRTIADNAKVALGTVGKLLEELEKENFVKQGNRNGGKFLFLYRLDELVAKWTTIYNTALRPKLVLGKFRVIGGALLKDDPLPPGILWGGEMAGAKLTEYLKPERQALYVSIPKVEAMKALKIVPDENGNIELVTVFWNEQLTNNPDFYEKQIVPPTIVYADLLNSHDSRNHETAERIKNKYLGK